MRATAMERKTQSFHDKIVSKLGKIDRQHLRDYILQLLSRKKFFETIFDHLGEGILVTDAALCILYSNPVARRMLQWPSNKLHLGEELDAHCPPGELRKLWTSLRRRPRRIEQYDCTIGEDAGRRVTVTAVSVEPSDEDRPARGRSDEVMWVFLLRDVTEHYRSIEEHARAQRLASLALLTSGVAHEIKNPLNSLNIHAQILHKECEKGGPLDAARVRRAAEVILEETSRLTEIVNQFIQAARPQLPVLERQSFGRVFEDLARIFGPECERAGITLRVEPDSDLPAIDMDAHLIFQALRNLVRNAIEAHAQPRDGDEAARPKFILVRARQVGDFLTLEVADNGPGIPQEDLDKVFEPYYTTKFSGTGLGLMVVYRIVAQHGGSIHVESHPGMGARFTISLPLAERPVRLLEKPREAPAEAAASSST